MFATVVLVIVVSSVIYWYLSRPKNIPPGLPALPIVGSLPFLGADLHLKFLEFRQRYGDTFSFYFGKDLLVVINNYETMKKVLNDDNFSGRDQDSLGSEPVKQNDQVMGVIISQGKLWKDHRRFALSTLRDFGMGKSWLEEAILEEVAEMCNQIITQKSVFFDPKVLFSCSVANVICALIFGKRFPHSDKRFQRMAVMTNQNIQDLEKVSILAGIPILKHIPGPLRTLYKKVLADETDMLKFLESMVEEHEQNQKDTGESERTSFIDAFFEEAKRQEKDPENTFTRFQLVVILGDLFAAGSETTSTTLLWAILLLSENPEVLRKIKKELAAHFSPEQLITGSDRTLLPYTEAAVMEVQRLASLVPVNVPHAALADSQIDGYNIPKGTLIMTNNYFIHRDPRYWSDPEKFEPMRFLDAQGKVFKPDGFVPFSIGKRACLGESLAKMELWLFLANLLNRFDFQLEDPTVSSKDTKFALVISPPTFKVAFKNSTSQTL